MKFSLFISLAAIATVALASTVSPLSLGVPPFVQELGESGTATLGKRCDPTTTSSSFPTSLNSWEAAMLEIHNNLRALHGVQPLRWNTTLVKFSEEYSRPIFDCNNVELVHLYGPYGENLAAGGFGSDIGSVQAWYDEIDLYDYDNPGYSAEVGHFTQLIWKDTSTIGCSRIMCDNSWSQYTICEYSDDRGNIIGTDRMTGLTYFELNVLPLLSNQKKK